MITAITIENFKGIRERVRLEMKPITLLFGPNSAGKSTLLQALHYAREVLLKYNLDAHETASGGAFVDLGGFCKFVHGHDRRLPVTLRLDIGVDRSEGIQEPNYSGGRDDSDGEFDKWMRHISSHVASIWIELSIRWNRESGKTYCSAYAVGINGLPFGRVQYELGEGAEFVELHLDHPLLSPNHHFDTSSLLGPPSESPPYLDLGWEDSLPGFDYQLETAQLVEPKLKRLLSLLVVGSGAYARDELRNFRYLGPLRSTPTGPYTKPDDVEILRRWPDGLGAWDCAIHGDSSQWLLKRINDWLFKKERFDAGHKLVINEYGSVDVSAPILAAIAGGQRFPDLETLKQVLFTKPLMREAVLVPTGNDVELRPSDLGVGITQVLPVIVTALTGVGLTAIEQPELHLHPRLQCALGDLLIHGALEQRLKTIIVETHSEHLILRILRRIRETTRGAPHDGIAVTPEDVAVWYVSKEDGQSVPRTIGIDKHGELTDNWPDDFFEQDFYERFS